MEFIDLKKQYQEHKEELDKAIFQVIQDANFINGSEVSLLEEELAAYTNRKYCISCANGTDSLDMALKSLNIGPGDEVITTPFSWISSSNVIKRNKAKAVFVDIEEEGFNLDASQVEASINKNTKAIIAVGLFGHMPNVSQLQKISEKYNIPIIEDAAQSFGATYQGVKSCKPFTFGSTSFFPAKPLGCYGDGGAIFTDDMDLAKELQAIKSHGGYERHSYHRVGYNSRLDTIQAAILRVKLRFFDREVRLKQEIAAKYTALIGEHVKTPSVLPDYTHVYALYTIRVANDMRDQVKKELSQAGVPVGVYYPKLISDQPLFQPEYIGQSFPRALKASEEVLSLPMHAYLENADIEKIADILNAVFCPEGV